MLKTTLVVGGTSAERELVIANTLSQNSKSGIKTAVLIEGLNCGQPILFPSNDVLVTRVTSGCICCNSPTLRVHLNRLIQQKPDQLFFSLANDLHFQQVRSFLTTPSYQKVLELADEINLKSIIR